MTVRTTQALQDEILRRRTFAIISHPDAGKTTLTEKLLLYGGAIQLAGSIKSRRAQRHATSDWMELERQRGISVTSSVMQFPYRERQVNLLDTPGHEDFSEDTYRTLTAVDSAVMLIDAAKGVEAQTRKLFHVCRLREIPILTFINKLDRFGKSPLDLMDELEEVLGIRSCPMNWPIGEGSDFKGIYDRQTETVYIFEPTRHGERQAAERTLALDDPALRGAIGPEFYDQLQQDIELLDVAGDPFEPEKVARGQLTPLFFGSAMNNFGVRLFLDAMVAIAPAPVPRQTSEGLLDPLEDTFTGFVFKIQANMNPAHRDRIAFVRICSGRFEAGMKARHVRLKRDINLANPQQFLAQERSAIEVAYAGDIIGLFDPGLFRIGDTLCQGKALEFKGFPRFSPEHFARLQLKDASKRKAMNKGLSQLSEEGAIQIFQNAMTGEREPILGAIGMLQFDVLIHRLKHEYGVEATLQPLPYEVARWIGSPGVDVPALAREMNVVWVEDRDGSPVLLFRDDWYLRRFSERKPDLVLLETTPW